MKHPVMVAEKEKYIKLIICRPIVITNNSTTGKISLSMKENRTHSISEAKKIIEFFEE
jgi:hypothetical protein